MAVGDTWVAKQTGTEGNSIITAYCYRPDGTLADSFTIEEPSDAVLLDASNYWFICIIAANNIVVVFAGNYVYSRDVNGNFHSYKYHSSTDDAAPWCAGFNNGQFFISCVIPYGINYTTSKFFTSSNGVTWTLRHTGSLSDGSWPGVIFNANYDATSGYYYVTSERELYDGYITYYNEVVISRTTNFSAFRDIGNEDEKWAWYDLNIDRGQVRWLNYRDDVESFFQRAYICELNSNGTINTLPVTNIPSGEWWVALYASCLVDLTGRPYFLLGERSAFSTFYVCKRNVGGTAYVKEGSALAVANMSDMWYMSNYRVYNPNYGYVTLEYHNTGPGSVRVVSSNTSGFVIPLHNSENWHCCYLETGNDFDPLFWCEYDDCNEERSDF